MKKSAAVELRLNAKQAGEYLGIPDWKVREHATKGLLEGHPAEYDNRGMRQKKSDRVQLRFTIAALDKFRSEEKEREAARLAEKAQREASKVRTQPKASAPKDEAPDFQLVATGNLAAAMIELRQAIEATMESQPAADARQQEMREYRAKTTELLTGIRGGIEVNNSLLERLVKGLGS